MNNGGVDAEREGESGIERADEQFLVEHDDEQRDDDGDNAHADQRGRTEHKGAELHEGLVERDGADLAVEHAFLVEVHLAGECADEDDANRKETGERDANGGVLFHARFLVNHLDEQRGENPGDERAEKHRGGMARVGDEKRHDEAGQYAVADGVADKCHATEDEIIADQAAGRGDEEAHERNPAEGVEVGRPRRDDDPMEFEGRDEVHGGVVGRDERIENG